jgi:uncharacterized protein (DUF488 family)
MLFTVGYQLRPPEDLLAHLSKAGVDVVIDVRETAWSHVPAYRSSTLARALAAKGIQYVHAQFAGNPKRLRDAAESHEECLELYREYLEENPDIALQFADLLRELGKQNLRGCLLCYERHPDDCHRHLLLEAVGIEETVGHIDPNGAPRFLKA